MGNMNNTPFSHKNATIIVIAVFYAGISIGAALALYLITP